MLAFLNLEENVANLQVLGDIELSSASKNLFKIASSILIVYLKYNALLLSFQIDKNIQLKERDFQSLKRAIKISCCLY